MKNINERNNFVFEFRPVTELFEEQVKLHPEKCAVVSGKESFTYAQDCQCTCGKRCQTGDYRRCGS